VSRGVNGIFDGVRVVELASGIAAPYATMFLADHGADVVKLEPPDGDPYRSEPGFQVFNRNKRSAVVANPADEERLLATADVIVVDQPGRASSIKAAHPGAIVVAMAPWGDDTSRSGDPATADLLAAECGLMWNQQSYTEAPIHLVLPLVSYGQAMLGALAIASALFARERDGVAPLYEVSGVAGGAAIQIGEHQPVGSVDERPGSAPMGSKGRVPCYRLFEAQDGRWLFVACGTARFYERLVTLIGRPDLIGDPRLPSPPWGLLDPDPVAVLAPILEEAFSTRDRDEWLSALREADVPAQPVLSRAEFLESSIVEANDLDVSVSHPDLGEIQMMGVPIVTEARPGSVRDRAPLLGEHTEELAGDDHRPATGSGQGDLPLAGAKVVDLASFIAGPVISRHLGMLGAEVVKIEAPGGDPFRAIGPMFTAWNQAKRSIVLDLKVEEDRALGHRLLSRADAVIENFRPGVAARLGVDAETLKDLNPDLVQLTSPGYGSDESMADAPAFDPLMQALGGIMEAQGGDAEPVFLTIAVHDVLTPLLGAFGVVAALYHRLRTGEVTRVRTSLAQTSAAAQAAELVRYEGAPEALRGGWDFAGPSEDRCWVDDGAGGFEFVDGDLRATVTKTGLINHPLAAANGLVTRSEYPDVGALFQFGQLVKGAGAAPSASPALDEHRAEILAELDG